MKTYGIVDAKGRYKDQWEEVKCEFVHIDGCVVKFYGYLAETTLYPNLLYAYKLADGESVMFITEEK